MSFLDGVDLLPPDSIRSSLESLGVKDAAVEKFLSLHCNQETDREKEKRYDIV